MIYIFTFLKNWMRYYFLVKCIFCNPVSILTPKSFTQKTRIQNYYFCDFLFLVKGCLTFCCTLKSGFDLRMTECINWSVFAYSLLPQRVLYLYCIFISQTLDIYANVICTLGFYSFYWMNFFSLFTLCVSCVLSLTAFWRHIWFVCWKTI